MKNKAFTLIEIMVGILIVSAVLVAGFSSYVKIGYGKIRLIEQTEIQKNSFYFSEKLFQMIKEGGTIDYEEYFNRKVIGTKIINGHYSEDTGFGNFGLNGKVASKTYGDGYYYCRSGNGEKLSGQTVNNGCYNKSNLTSSGEDYKGIQQRYGQYSFQFVDYNSNYNNDLGDENNDGNIIGDDDDEYLGLGPSVFTAGSNVRELYLISGDKRSRTFFRWNWVKDSDAPEDKQDSCTGTGFTDGCRGTIEFIRFEGKDWGLDHKEGTNDSTEYDGVIDTWVIDKQFTNSATSEIVAGSVKMENYWESLFPTSVNITSFKIYVYPNIDYNLSWKEKNLSSNISPYVILNYKMKPSWETRKRLQSDGKEIIMNTTVNLTDIFSK